MRRPVDRATLLLGFAVLLLGGGVWFIATRPIAVAPIVDLGSGATAPGAGVERVKPGPLAAYSETLKRPLFEPTRRPTVAKPPEVVRPREPPLPPPVVAKAPPPSAEGMKLLGVVRSGREPFRALVRTRDGESGSWVVEGSQLGPWRVVGIADGRVVIEAQGHRVELAMFAEPKPIVKR